MELQVWRAGEWSAKPYERSAVGAAAQRAPAVLTGGGAPRGRGLRGGAYLSASRPSRQGAPSRERAPAVARAWPLRAAVAALGIPPPFTPRRRAPAALGGAAVAQPGARWPAAAMAP